MLTPEELHERTLTDAEVLELGLLGYEETFAFACLYGNTLTDAKVDRDYVIRTRRLLANARSTSGE